MLQELLAPCLPRRKVNAREEGADAPAPAPEEEAGAHNGPRPALSRRTRSRHPEEDDADDAESAFVEMLRKAHEVLGGQTQASPSSPSDRTTLALLAAAVRNEQQAPKGSGAMAGMFHSSTRPYSLLEHGLVSVSRRFGKDVINEHNAPKLGRDPNAVVGDWEAGHDGAAVVISDDVGEMRAAIFTRTVEYDMKLPPGFGRDAPTSGRARAKHVVFLSHGGIAIEYRTTTDALPSWTMGEFSTIVVRLAMARNPSADVPVMEAPVDPVRSALASAMAMCGAATIRIATFDVEWSRPVGFAPRNIIHAAGGREARANALLALSISERRMEEKFSQKNGNKSVVTGCRSSPRAAAPVDVRAAMVEEKEATKDRQQQQQQEHNIQSVSLPLLLILVGLVAILAASFGVFVGMRVAHKVLAMEAAIRAAEPTCGYVDGMTDVGGVV